jgi:prepilin-type N-terminal cleavage/methylation domain-containing protein
MGMRHRWRVRRHGRPLTLRLPAARLAGQSGLTLVEIMVAAAIIGIGMVGLFFVVPISSYGVQEGSQLSTATFLAEQRLEQVRNARWSGIPDIDCLGLGPTAAPTVPAGKTCTMGATTIAAGNVTFADETSVAGYTGYGRTVRVQDCGVTACAGLTDVDMRLVTVGVSYTPLTGQGVATSPKTITLSLLVSKR